MALSPKELLKDEFSSSMRQLDEPAERASVPSSSTQAQASRPGKQGFTWREVDPSFSQSVETYQKVFICIVSNRLLFSAPQPASMSENLFIAEHLGSFCHGFLELSSKSEVRVKTSASGQKKFGFLLKDGYATVSFYAETEAERDKWTQTIREAVQGTSHVLPECALRIPPLHFGNSNDLPVDTSATVDFPRKAGFLKKTSSGSSTFGIKSIKKRWFRLEAGELRYYEDEDMRESKLKGTLSLQGAKVVSSDNTNTFINLLLATGRNMRLEAPTARDALEWRDAFSETVAILELQRASTRPQLLNRRRRLNLHDHVAVPKPPVSSPQASVAPMSRPRSLFGSFSSSPTPAATSPTASASGGSPIPPPPASPLAASSSPPPPSPPGRLSRLLSRTSSNLVVDSPAQVTFKSPAVMDMLKACLGEHFLLKHIVHDLLAVIEAMTERLVAPGEVVIWQGDSGDVFYVLEQGQCEVSKDGIRVGHVFAGKSFGEMALLSNTMRQATVRACQASRLWCLTRQALRIIATQQETARLAEKVTFLRGIELFDKLLDSSLDKIAEVMVLRTYNTGDRIIRQGDPGDAFYMIASGRVSVTQQTGFGPPVELVKLTPGKYFGELALMEDAPRKATVTATSTVTCWTLDRSSFTSLFRSLSTAVQQSQGIKMLRQVKILSELSDRQLNVVASRLANKVFVEGEVIIKQGEVGECFYMIANGSVSVHVNHIQVATLETGGFFGEMSLISNEKRSATVTALTDTTCLLLSRNDFNELLGPLDAIIAAGEKRRTEIAERTLKRKSTSNLLMNQLRGFASFPQSPNSTANHKRISSNAAEGNSFASTSAMFELDNLDKLKVLASGTFSTVFLVQHYFTSKHYAMKRVFKQKLLQMDQEATAQQEKEVMLALSSSPYCPALYATLQDANSLYYIQQYVPGGDLWSLLYGTRLGTNKSGGIPHHAALFYSACALGAIQHMHNVDVIHRDLKPENLVIDSGGYLKVVDYGTAKVLPLSSRTRTLLGCAEYLAPEMIFCKQYNRSVDFWQLGILMFELLTRTTPFAHTNMAMLFQHIIDCEEVLKTFFTNSGGNFDASARATITALLSANPGTRLGLLHDGIEGVWTSPFFKTTSVEALEKRQLSPPFIPGEAAAAAGNTLADSLDSIVVPIEEVEEPPHYTGAFDYSQF